VGTSTRAAVKIDGLSKLVSTMRKAGVDMEDMKAANQTVALIVAKQGQINVPVKTGRLRSSIRGSRAKSKATVRAGNGGVKYAGYVHWGTHKMPPTLFLTNAAEQTQPEWVDDYYRELERLVGRINGA
jgi:HK97 gp10 family phage protein